MTNGSGRGIGRAIGLQLAADNHKVVINYRSDAQAAEQTAKLVTESGGQAIVQQADISRPDAVRAPFDIAQDTFGGIDVAVHNAYAMHPGPLATVTTPTSTRTSHARRRPVRLHLHPDHPHGPTRQRAVLGQQAGRRTTRAHLRPEIAERKITANSILPGQTDTDAWRNAGVDVHEFAQQIPLGRVGQPADIAAMVSFLVSDQANWITGQSFVVDGGTSLLLL